MKNESLNRQTDRSASPKKPLGSGELSRSKALRGSTGPEEAGVKPVKASGPRRSGTRAPSPETEKDFGKNLQTFEKLPAKTKEVLLLKHQAEKATGPESVALNKTIQEKSKKRTT